MPVFDDRLDLLQRILYYLKSKNFWHIEYHKSANLDSHVIMAEKRIVEDDNPIICTGNLIYYQAYNIDELSASFRHYDDDGFRFKRPDGDAFTPDFTVSEISSLIKFLGKCFPDKYTDFIQLLQQGILFLGNINSRLDKIRSWYKNGGSDALRKFTILIFLMSMKMKKWKGSPYKYPLIWNEEKRDINLLRTRDTNTEMALSEYIQFLDSLDGNTKVKICEIPRISYNFKSCEIRIGYETINSILEFVANGTFCLAHSSDILLQTAYIIWIKIMGYNIKDINNDLRKELKCETQPDFDPKFITTTGHIDPTNELRDF